MAQKPATLGNPCEYGCAGPCEVLEHWRRRAEYWMGLAREWEVRCRADVVVKRRQREALREIEDLPMGPADAPISGAQTIARAALDGEGA